MHYRYLLAAALLACVWLPLHAATPKPVVDPPARVARVSWLAGTVSVLPANSSQWQFVDINRPLVSGDQLATDAGARVELQMGNAVTHLSGNTDFSLLALGKWRTQMALTQGTAELDVFPLPDGEDVEIDTPQVAVVVDRSARVRVDVGGGGAVTVTVWQGSVVVQSDNGAQMELHAGQRYRFDSSALAGAVALTFGSGDAFDHWSRARDQWYAGSAQRRYVSAGTVGYRGLDHYGQWQEAAGYGEVWFPDDVAAGWAPYRQGYWAWIAPWGWTWMSSEPWGFAPFHYGRWASIGGRWGWLPGPAGIRAVYAPALVAFFGGNGWNVSLGVTISSAPIGWYPLGPDMIYNPWYAADWRYYARINRCDIRFHHGHRQRRVKQAYNAWRKPQLARHIHYLGRPPRGITVVSRQTLARGHAVAVARLHPAVGHLRRAPVRFHGLHIAAHPARAAKWHPPHFAKRPDQSVVAARRRLPAQVAVRHRQTDLRHFPRARLLAHRVDVPRRPARRLLPKHASSLVGASKPKRVAHAGETIHAVPASPSPLVAPAHRSARTAHTALPRVARLHLRLQRRPRSMTRGLLPTVARLQAAHALSQPPRRARAFAPDRAQPRPAQRSFTRHVADPPRRIRTLRHAQPRPEPSPRRDHSRPVMVRHVANFHPVPHHASHHASPHRQASGRRGRPPPIRIESH